jgi:hypothetical protein
MPHQEIKAKRTEILLLITACVMKKIEWCEKVFDMEHRLLCVTIIVELIPGIDQRDKLFSSKIQL